MKYNLDFFDNFDLKDYNLPNDISNNIQILLNNLGITTQVNKNNRKQRKAEMENNWLVKKEPFKVTQIEKKEGIEKLFNNIRANLNKLTEKNFDKIIDLIFESIDEITLDNEDNNQNVRIINMIIDISSNNSAYSEVYSNLYISLLNKYDFLIDSDNYIIEEYLNLLDNIEYVNPSENYDKFCEINKINQKRRSQLLFILNLFKKSVVTLDKFISIFNVINTKLNNQLYANTFKEVNDELTENYLVIISNLSKEIRNDNIFICFKKEVERLSKLKTTDCIGLSNRSIFKFMDMNDLIKKKL
jgi:hypothetical protein